MVLTIFGIFLLGVFLTFLDVDTVFLVFKVLELNPVKGTSGFSFLLALRFLIQSAMLYAMTRSVSFVLVATLLGLKIMMHCIQLLEERIFEVWTSSNSFFSCFQKQVILYHCLSIIVFGYLDIFSSPFTFAMMSAGLGLEVASVFTIIRLQVLIQLSWPTYVSIIILAVIITLICEAMLPQTIRFVEDTELTLRNWNLRLVLIRKDRRYYIKKLRSLRHCSVYAGLFNVHLFPLVKRTKSTYYSLIIYYVINTLISVPGSITLKG
jgi:hypothetical protein